MKEKKLIFEKSVEGRKGNFIKKPDIPLKEANQIIPSQFLRENLRLPSLGELDVVRHYTNLARLNYCIDTHFYPLGSCTMKYNPKLNEDLAGLEEFINLHPYQNERDCQGALELIYNLERLLCEITGMARFTFQPSAGAHGELTGLLMIRAYHNLAKDNKRYKVIIPDSAHGTNPATASMCGYKVVTVESNPDGLVDVDKLRKVVDTHTAAMMLTCPNTLGLFEEDILDISDIIHKNGALLYYDGANFNALLGITKPSLLGFDVVHLNLHKTFSTPHGSGGPGAGAVGVDEDLKDFLPIPLVDKEGARFYLNYNLKHSIGRVRTFLGNFTVLVKTYAYILRLGREGLLDVAYNAVLNANYIREKLKGILEVASRKRCMHEVVFSCKRQKEKGVSALDIAKRLIDYGIHPPTMYFPLVVKEALMVEPTETESKETLDYFIEVMRRIDKEIEQDPQVLKQAPHTTPIKRLDEAGAARQPILRWQDYGD
jgi:glycine dehydrogenase subunit 2